MAEIDNDLVAALRAARGGKPMQFAYLVKGAEGSLLVAKKLSAKEIADAKKAAKAKRTLPNGAGLLTSSSCAGARPPRAARAGRANVMSPGASSWRANASPA